MIYNSNGWRVFGGVLLVIGISLFWNAKPKFVLPPALIPAPMLWLKRILTACLVLLLILVSFDIQSIKSRQILTQKKVPIQILFDVSLSMSAKDLKPNRFFAARDSLRVLTEKLDGYPISLIAFSGIPLIYIPYSTDAKAIQGKLAHMSLADFPPVQEFLGTAIGDALLLGIQNTRKQYASGGVLILITDGDSNIGHDPKQAADIAKLYHMPIFSLGIGQSSYIVGYDKSFQKVMTNIDMSLLETIAEQTYGDFQKVVTQADMDQFFDTLARKIREQERQYVQKTYTPLNLVFFPIMGILLLGRGLVMVIGVRRKKN